MIDLIGKDVSEAKDFAASNDLNLEIDEKESDEGINPAPSCLNPSTKGKS